MEYLVAYAVVQLRALSPRSLHFGLASLLLCLLFLLLYRLQLLLALGL